MGIKWRVKGVKIAVHQPINQHTLEEYRKVQKNYESLDILCCALVGNKCDRISPYRIAVDMKDLNNSF